jgi:hypothetical protein
MMTKAEEVLAEIKKAYPDMPYYDDNKLSELLWTEWGQEHEHGETGAAHRWLTDKITYWGFGDGSWLAIEWASGNTENQESEGPYDVYPVEQYEEVVVTKKYRKYEIVDG